MMCFGVQVHSEGMSKKKWVPSLVLHASEDWGPALLDLAQGHVPPVTPRSAAPGASLLNLGFIPSKPHPSPSCPTKWCTYRDCMVHLCTVWKTLSDW